MVIVKCLTPPIFSLPLGLAARRNKQKLVETEGHQDLARLGTGVARRAIADALSLHDLIQLLRAGESQPIPKVFAEHDDPIVRFASRGSMAYNADADSAQGLYDLIHDHSLSQTDRQVICSWCNGVSIRLSDPPSRIVEQFAIATSKAPKFEKGEVAPDFEVEAVSGLKLASQACAAKWSYCTFGVPRAVLE